MDEGGLDLDLRERPIRTIRNALTEGRTGNYCIYRRDEYGNPHHQINWETIERVYACAIYVSPPDYSRRLIVVPGAVISYVHDGARSYCTVYGEEILLKKLGPFSEIYVYSIPPIGWLPNDVNFARAVCMR